MKSDDELLKEIFREVEGQIDDVVNNDFSDFFAEEWGEQNPDGTWQPTKGWRDEAEYNRMVEISKRITITKPDPHTIVVRYD